MELALYRACRPRRFDEFVGQEHVTRTLRNALAQGRLAHAYLFCGPRGTGKTSAARVLAKALSCSNARGGEPCGECETCTRIGAGEGIDVIEMDAASNRGIDEIRSLRERIRLAPVAGRYKIYVIDEVHMLTNEAFNALLKTLEEPPANVLFVLCTTEAYRVPPTILSRCQRFDFHRLGVEQIAAHLAKIARERGISADPAALRMIARAATGSVRDALGILDQCVAYAPRGLALDDARRVLGAVDGAAVAALAGAILQGDVGMSWGMLDDLLAQGRDSRDVARALVGHFRDVLLCALAGRWSEFTGPAADDPDTLARQADGSHVTFLCQAIEALAAVEAEMRMAPQPRLLLEARIVRLCTGAGLSKGQAAARNEEGVAPTRAARAAPPGPEAERPAPQEAPASEAPESEAPEQGSEPAPHEELPPQPHEELPDVRELWPEVLAQVSDIDAGWLDGARPRWDGPVLRVSLPVGREIAAARLTGGDGQRTIARIVAAIVGRPVAVSIEVPLPAGGLFSPERSRGVAGGAAESGGHGRPAKGSTPDAGRPAGRPGGGSGRDTAGAADQTGGSLTKQAEAMFRAEQVKGGPTGGPTGR